MTAEVLDGAAIQFTVIRSGGKIVDVVLEIWAIFVITAVAGSFASFFSSGDQE